MIVINFDEYNLNRKSILKDISSSTFVYPTDTIYGAVPSMRSLSRRYVN